VAARLWASAALSAATAWGVKIAIGVHHHPWILGAATLIPFGCVYFACTDLLGVGGVRDLVRRKLG